MSDERTGAIEGVQPGSQEERFLGVMTTVEDHDTGNVEVETAQPKQDLEIEVVDDRPEEDRRAPRDPNEPTPDEMDEDLEQHSKGVQKRIDKLKYEYHEQRRQAEDAQKERDEALRIAQIMKAERDSLVQLAQKQQGFASQRFKQEAERNLEQAKRELIAAQNLGDAERIVEAQENLLAAREAVANADNVMRGVGQEWFTEHQKQQAQFRQQMQQQPVRQEAPEPSERALKWQEENPWFMRGQSEQDETLTAIAFSIHQRAIANGVDPESDVYYDALDRGLAPYKNGVSGNATPAQNDEGGAHGAKPAQQVVAPAGRNNGSRPKKVRLTKTQVNVAKRLGITPEQYAAQLIKDGMV